MRDEQASAGRRTGGPRPHPENRSRVFGNCWPRCGVQRVEWVAKMGLELLAEAKSRRVFRHLEGSPWPFAV